MRTKHCWNKNLFWGFNWDWVLSTVLSLRLDVIIDGGKVKQSNLCPTSTRALLKIFTGSYQIQTLGHQCDIDILFVPFEIAFPWTEQEKPCKKNKRTSFFALCVRHASDENLYNGCNKPGPNRSVTMPTLKPFTVSHRNNTKSSSKFYSSLFFGKNNEKLNIWF